VLIQFKSQSLLQHMRDGWEASGLVKSHFIIPVPAQMRSSDETWYRGTADAIHQNINLIEQAEPHVVAIFGADHIYRMNIRHMLEYHESKRAEATVAAIPVARELADQFGVIETDRDGSIIGFHEKNADAPTIPGNPKMVYASMGNYIFSTPALIEELQADNENKESTRDFGRDILPKMAGKRRIFAYDFQTSHIPGDPPGAPSYWRDVGTIDAYYEASMDLKAISPALNLYNRQWPLYTAGYSDAPAKFTFDEEGRRGQAVDSIVSGGSILSGGSVINSVLGRGCRIHTGALVEESVLFDNVDIGRHAKVRKAILEKNVQIPPNARIGYDLEKDKRDHHVTETGIVVVEGTRSPVEIGTMQI
jgi:glucose-1-phosphate adenylyltransferase